MSKKHTGSKVHKATVGRRAIAPLKHSVDELSAWFKTALGRAILSAQKKILARELHNLFGYHLMQLSVVPETRLFSASRINHCFSLAPKEGASRKKISGVSDFDALPLPDECVDVCVLHHVLDFAEYPQQVLKEAARVTIPNGYIVLLGFNPLSLRGLSKLPMQFFSRKAIWHHNDLRPARVQDWLGFLDFSLAPASYSYFNFPINSKKYLRNTHFSFRWGWSQKLPFGAVYCMVARKDKLAMTPLRPAWEPAPAIVQPAAVSRRAVNAASSHSSAIILPLRRRKIINKT